MLSSGFIRRHSRTFAALAFLFAYSVGISFATPPVSPYQPGATLQPSCLPGSTNCTTQILPSQSGNTNRILSTDGTNTTWVNTLTGVSLSGSTNTLTNIPNTALTNSTITINGSAIALGGSVSNLALVTNPLSQFASTTSAQLASTISDETGTGTLVYATSPTLTTVGINTAPTASPLTVGGDIRIATGSGGQIVFADGSTMSSAGLGSAAALSNTTDAIVTGDSDANSSGDIILKTGSTDRFHILNNGNVGVGTATPSTRFVVHDGATEIQMHTDTNNAFIDSTGGLALSAGGTNKNTYLRASGTGYIAINDTTSGVVSIATGGGNVGVGTATPSALFSVGSTSPFQVTNTGAVTALSYTKTGGTSSQFLKADGSVDATAYLPLAGGTLSGDITITKNSASLFLNGGSASNAGARLQLLGYNTGGKNWQIDTGFNTGLSFTPSTTNGGNTFTTPAFYIDNSSNATFTGSVTGGAASFTTGAFSSTLDVTGQSNIGGQGRFKGWYTSGTGMAVELGVSSSQGNVIGFDRTNTRYIPLLLSGGDGIGGSPTTLTLSTGLATFSNPITTGVNSITGGAGTFNGAFVNSSTTPAVFSNSGASNYNYIELRGGTVGSAVNWALQKDNTTANAFQITPSTANGGSTYSTPVLTITSTGNLTTTGGYSGTTGTFGSTAAATGNVRLPFDNAIRWRNAGNTADLGFYLGSSNTFFTDAPLNVTGNLTVNNGANSYIYGQTTNSYIRLDNSIGAQIRYVGFSSMTFDSNGATIANANGTSLILNYAAYPNDVYSAAGYKNLIAGGFTLMYRNDRDSYIGSNTQYSGTGTTKAVYSAAEGSGMLSMVGGELNWLTYDGAVTGGSTYALTSKLSISKDGNSNFTGSVAVGSMLTVNIPDISTGENKGVQLNNSGGGGKVWNITAGRTGVNNGDFTIRNSTADINALYFDGTTNTATFANLVNINGASGAYPLNINNNNGSLIRMFRGGSNTVEMFMSPSSTTTFYITTDNSVGVSLSAGATSWGAYSDERMKVMNEFIPFENALEKIVSLRAGTGRYKLDAEGVSRSFLIAQDVQAVLPEAVSVDGEGMLALRYQEVIPLLVAADKEIAQKIAGMELRLQGIPTFEDQTLYTKIASFLEEVIGQGRVRAEREVCIGDETDQVCVTKEELRALLSGSQSTSGSGDSSGSSPAPQPTCSDGIQNQDETAVDTGGVCASLDPSPDASVPPPTDVPPPEESPATV